MNKREQYIQEVREGIKLTDEEWRKAWREGRYNGGGDIGSNQAILKAQIAKALSDPHIAIVDPEQELPIEPEFYEDWGGQSGKQGYISGQQDMQNDNWLKVIPKEEYIKEV